MKKEGNFRDVISDGFVARGLKKMTSEEKGKRLAYLLGVTFILSLGAYASNSLGAIIALFGLKVVLLWKLYKIVRLKIQLDKPKRLTVRENNKFAGFRKLFSSKQETMEV